MTMLQEQETAGQQPRPRAIGRLRPARRTHALAFAAAVAPSAACLVRYVWFRLSEPAESGLFPQSVEEWWW